MDLVMLLAAGFGGGVVRGLVGFTKHQFAFSKVEFNLGYFLMMMFVSGVVGLLTAAILVRDPLLSFVSGYAGGDFIENAYKIIAKKKNLWEAVEVLVKEK